MWKLSVETEWKRHSTWGQRRKETSCQSGDLEPAVARWTGRRLLLDRARHPRHIVLDKERIHHRDGHRPQQGARHQRSPVINIALNQFSDHCDRDSLDPVSYTHLRAHETR